ncbi:cell wall anchor protein, partial [Paraburkholderia agricolaris]
MNFKTMTRHHTKTGLLLTAVGASALSILAACGGGSTNTGGSTTTSSTATPTAMTGTVAIGNALVGANVLVIDSTGKNASTT